MRVLHPGEVGVRRFLRSVVRGYGWRLGGLAAVATVAGLKYLFG